MSDKIIHFIYADGCEDCKKMKDSILHAMSEYDEKIVLEEVNSEEEEAIRLGIKFHLSNLPACIIGLHIFSGSNYTYKDFVYAIETTWKIKQKQKKSQQ